MSGHAGSNNFNLMRLVAAWLILFGHSFTLYNHSPDPLAAYTKLPGATFYALACFFTISGYLVTASWQRQPHFAAYAANRMLRIYPGLMVAVLLTVFVIGPLVSVLPVADYMAHTDTWKYLRTMLVFGMRYELPGVFETLPYANAVNGSLWSLKLEVQCYILLALLGAAGLLKTRFLPLLALLCLTGNAYLASIADPPRYVLGLKYNNLTSLTLWGFFFWAGGSFQLYRHALRYSYGRLIAVLMLAFAGYTLLPYGYYLHAALLPYLLLGLALHVPAATPRWLKQNDLSYGIYLYAFPIQQCYMLYVGEGYGIGGFILASTLLTLLAAWFSWRWVEYPALKRKPSRRNAALAMAA